MDFGRHKAVNWKFQMELIQFAVATTWLTSRSLWTCEDPIVTWVSIFLKISLILHFLWLKLIQVSKFHQNALTIITVVCSIISCICIVLTLLAFRFVKVIKKSREQSTTKDLTAITAHLCVCLLIALLLFLAGILAQGMHARVTYFPLFLLSLFIIITKYYFNQRVSVQ